MKKFLLLIFLLMLNVQMSQSMYVQVPKDEILFQCFNEIILGHFYANSVSLRQISGKKKEVWEVYGALNFALCEYVTEAGVKTAEDLQQLKLNILEILLQDNPEEFEKLKEKIISFAQESKYYQSIETDPYADLQFMDDFA